MYEVHLVNKQTMESFIKLFTSELQFRKFIYKCRFSKKLKVVSYFKY